MMTTESAENGFPGFEKCIELIRSDDAIEFEDGFAWLVGWGDAAPRLTGHTKELIELMRNEVNPFKRGRFIELLGYTDAKEVVPLLAAELENENREVRDWAILSLDGLAFPDALRISQDYKRMHPEEWGDQV